ncbi:MAG: alpha/beta hydrolase [Chthoniobacterales bacterium]
MKNLLFLIFALLLILAPGLQAAENPEKISDLIYGNAQGRLQRLDIYYPRTQAPPSGYPLIICFHGGAWAIGNKHWDLVLRNLTKYGYAVASVDYRLSGQAIYPAQFLDARNATRWLLKNASRLRLDSQRIGVSGVSAGGQIALLLAFTQNQNLHGSPPLPKGTIKAVCVLYPVTDLISIVPPKKRTNPGNLISRLLGAPLADRMALAKLASPLTHVRRGIPPVLLIHGDKDSLVPLSQSKTLLHAAQACGADCILWVYANRQHGFGLYPSTLTDVGKFFDRNLKTVKVAD